MKMDCRSKAIDRTSIRFKLGLTLLVLSYVLGWPMLALLESIAAYLKSPSLAIVIAPGLYVLSWLLLGASVLLVGPDAKKYLLEFYQKWKESRQKSKK